MDIDDLPDSLIERATMMEGILTAAATGGSPDNRVYEYLRREFMSDEILKALLPSFVRTNRNLGAFWLYIKNEAGSYAERRQIISAAFTPIVEHLEGANRAPADTMVGDILQQFDTDGIAAVWAKALSRRSGDPEGAITVARTLLETVVKHILDERDVPYGHKDDLPKLYGLAARALNMAPDQHTEEPIKMILGGAMTFVNGIGTLRNRFSDAHAPGGKVPVKPSPRHAALAVNMSGAMASFMIETYIQQQETKAAA